MTTQEFSDEFDILASSYRRFKAFDHMEQLDSLDFNEYEKSIYLTKAQEDIVKELYSGKYTGNAFESSEQIRRELESLIEQKTYSLKSTEESTDNSNTDNNSTNTNSDDTTNTDTTDDSNVDDTTDNPTDTNDDTNTDVSTDTDSNTEDNTEDNTDDSTDSNTEENTDTTDTTEETTDTDVDNSSEEEGNEDDSESTEDTTTDTDTSTDDSNSTEDNDNTNTTDNTNNNNNDNNLIVSETLSDGKYIHSVFSLPLNLLYIIYEQVSQGTDNECLNKLIADVYPVTHDQYWRIRNNPFRGPNNRRVLRLDKGNTEVELVSKYTIAEYIIRYLKKPDPIVLDYLPNESIDNVSTPQTCLLNTSLHREILERAVRMALSSKINLTNNKDKGEK